MKKTILSLLAFFAMIAGALAQDEGIPAYRAKGYKGNVSITSLGLYWNGVETSHGYMLSDRFYLGGGVGVLAGSVWDVTLATRVFADAQTYWNHRKSTPTSKLRLGYLRNYYGEADMFDADITFGWSWGLASGYGLSFDIGVSTIHPSGILVASFNRPEFSLAPVLSFSVEF